MPACLSYSKTRQAASDNLYEVLSSDEGCMKTTFMSIDLKVPDYSLLKGRRIKTMGYNENYSKSIEVSC